MRILYVEDNNTNVILVQRVANMGKHEVINCDDGEDALDKFEQIKPDLVLLDVQLRGPLTGLDVARILRDKGCVLPIIAVTAYAMKGDRQLCIEAGCDDYLPKPVSVSELVTVFKRYSDAVAAGKPILSSNKPVIIAPIASPTPAPVQPMVAPVVPTSSVDIVRPAEPVSAITAVPVPVPAVPVVESPASTPPKEPVAERTPAPVNAEP